MHFKSLRNLFLILFLAMSSGCPVWAQPSPIPVLDTASDISITDSGGYYTSTNVEGALQEVGDLNLGVRYDQILDPVDVSGINFAGHTNTWTSTKTDGYFFNVDGAVTIDGAGIQALDTSLGNPYPLDVGQTADGYSIRTQGKLRNDGVLGFGNPGRLFESQNTGLSFYEVYVMDAGSFSIARFNLQAAVIGQFEFYPADGVTRVWQATASTGPLTDTISGGIYRLTAGTNAIQVATGSGAFVVGNTQTAVEKAEVQNTTGGTLALMRHDTTVTAGDLIGRLSFRGNDTQLTTQTLFGAIEAYAPTTVTTDAAEGYMRFLTTSSTAAGSPVERMRIDSSGRVGIGSTAVEVLLEVQATEGNNSSILLDADDGDDNADSWFIQSTASDNDLDIINHTSTLVTIQSDGDVGIGTTAPGVRLDVSGAIRGSGDITSTDTGDLGWSLVTGANTACSTTCTNACVFGWDTAVTEVAVSCSDATADKCLCAGAS